MRTQGNNALRCTVCEQREGCHIGILSVYCTCCLVTAFLCGASLQRVHVSAFTIACRYVGVHVILTGTRGTRFVCHGFSSFCFWDMLLTRTCACASGVMTSNGREDGVAIPHMIFLRCGKIVSCFVCGCNVGAGVFLVQLIC